MPTLRSHTLPDLVPPSPPPRLSWGVRAFQALAEWMECNRPTVAGVATTLYLMADTLLMCLVFRWLVAVLQDWPVVFLIAVAAWIGATSALAFALFYPLAAWTLHGTDGMARRVPLLPVSGSLADRAAYEAWASRHDFAAGDLADTLGFPARQGWNAGVEHCRRILGLPVGREGRHG